MKPKHLQHIGVDLCNQSATSCGTGAFFGDLAHARIGAELIPNVRARPVAPGDGNAITKMMERLTPLHNDICARLPSIIDHLAEEEAIIGTIVETVATRRAPAHMVGSTMLAFVSDQFASDYCNAPYPALTSHLLRLVGAKDTGVFLNRKQQAEGNTGQGMEQVILEFAVEPMDLASPAFSVVMNELYSAHFQFERGYNVKSVFVEANSAFEPLILGTGMRPQKYFDIAGTNEDLRIPTEAGTKRGFYKVSRSEMASLAPSCAAAIIMTYMAPTFKFTPSEQRLLKRALEGATDDAIATAFDVSRDAVKQTWRGIYDHVLDVMPDMFDDGSEQASGRGNEKRRRIVAHVRSNLQELKPHHLRRG